MTQKMGNMKPLGFCKIDFNRRRKKWPYFDEVGLWCITPPATYYGPNYGSEWFTITHKPTGWRGGDIRVDNPRKAKVLERYSLMFGKSLTVVGVRRKYRKLSPTQKRWLKKQVAWLLPKREGCAQ